jgi:hypothetical protein
MIPTRVLQVAAVVMVLVVPLVIVSYLFAVPGTCGDNWPAQINCPLAQTFCNQCPVGVQCGNCSETAAQVGWFGCTASGTDPGDECYQTTTTALCNIVYQCKNRQPPAPPTPCIKDPNTRLQPQNAFQQDVEVCQ